MNRFVKLIPLPDQTMVIKILGDIHSQVIKIFRIIKNLREYRQRSFMQFLFFFYWFLVHRRNEKRIYFYGVSVFQKTLALN